MQVERMKSEPGNWEDELTPTEAGSPIRGFAFPYLSVLCISDILNSEEL